MKNISKRKVLSLHACRKLLPIMGAAKYICILATIFFQQEDTVACMVVFASLTIIALCLDSFLKISAWKCRHCGERLPYDFYSRKTLRACPKCGEELDFSQKTLLVESDVAMGK